MKMKLMAAAALVAAFAMPALAADTFYLVQDSATMECSVVDAAPTSDTMKVIGSAHETMEQAEAALKADASCATK